MKDKYKVLLLIPLLSLLVGCGEDSERVDSPQLLPAATSTALVPLSMDTAAPRASLDSSSTYGSSGLHGIRVERVFPNLDFQKLTNLAQPDNGSEHIFVSEQAGLVHLLLDSPQAPRSRVFLDIRHKVSEGNRYHPEEGLLGLVFDPQYSTNGYFYVYYSASDPRRSILSRFSVNPNDPAVADPDSELVVMEFLQPNGHHNGGQLAFGPDGYLYIGLGDGGSMWDSLQHAQNLETVLGSILRIDLRDVPEGTTYAIPPDNPFQGSDKAREEIWAYGLRNPWRFSFDLETELLWAGDVGQDSWEEINIIRKGMNYGWNLFEGHLCLNQVGECEATGVEFPVAQYSHANGCSIIGGYVYRGIRMPELVGTYIYGDFCTGEILGIRYLNGEIVEQELLLDTDLSISSFGRATDGTLYVLSRNDGIYRIAPGSK